jgi:hypothetical protein
VKRRLLNFLAALSLLLCGVSIALWVRSYFRSDTAWYSRPAQGETFASVRWWQFDTARGDVAVARKFARYRGAPRQTPLAGWRWQTNAPTDRVFLASGARTRFETGARAAGFEFYSAEYDGADGSRSGQRRIVVPVWAVVLVTAALPAVRLWRRLRRGRFAPCHCRRCGYDLRGNESGVCPECGRAVAPA